VVIAFDTVISAFGNNPGIEVPADALMSDLGAGRRPKAVVQVGD